MNYWSMPSLRERQKAMKEKINYVENIIKEICKYYSLTTEQIKGKSRKREIVKARFISIYIIKNETDFTLSAIRRIFNRDHSTILHSIKIINNTIEHILRLNIKFEEEDIRRFLFSTRFLFQNLDRVILFDNQFNLVGDTDTLDLDPRSFSSRLDIVELEILDKEKIEREKQIKILKRKLSIGGILSVFIFFGNLHLPRMNNTHNRFAKIVESRS